MASGGRSVCSLAAASGLDGRCTWRPSAPGLAWVVLSSVRCCASPAWRMEMPGLPTQYPRQTLADVSGSRICLRHHAVHLPTQLGRQVVKPAPI